MLVDTPSCVCEPQPVGRSGVLSGKVQQRSRAKTRGRQDRQHRDPCGDPHRELAARIAAVTQIDGCDALEQLDLRVFLQRTGDLEVGPAERLRRLAITSESAGRCAEQPRGWLALDRIYAAAHQLDPSDPWVCHSRGISATECAAGAAVTEEARRRVFAAAHAALVNADALAPDDPNTATRVCLAEPSTDGPRPHALCGHGL